MSDLLTPVPLPVPALEEAIDDFAALANRIADKLIVERSINRELVIVLRGFVEALRDKAYPNYLRIDSDELWTLLERADVAIAGAEETR